MRNSSPQSVGWFVVHVVLTGAAALLSACGGGDSPDQALRTRFPAQAAQILEGAASPAPDDGGFRLNATDTLHEGRKAPGITASFPRNGAQPVRFDLPSGASFYVRERGVRGHAEAAGAAIAYARDGGTAFWTRTASGYEEWLLLEAGIACPGAEVAAWEVEGG
ncbi:MAG TPA: hypothetical protein VE093_14840, partial [Polyangiaceae bacterium]|nr:hypothetical protein [Polyangiaceae bacterium]